ncbi:MAG: hypothetical protein ACJ746_05930 [Bryobacteraceae bacterium]
MRSAARILPVRLARHRRRLPRVAEAVWRVAQISHPGVLFEKASYFPLESVAALEEYRPQALVGSSVHLLQLARILGSREAALPDLDGAVFIMTDFRDAPLNDKERITLWNAFSVPVYEIVLADDGALLACECEAQEGWHVENGVRFSRLNDQLWYSRRGRQTGTGLVGEIQDEPCPCGRPGQRITNAAIDFRDPVRQKLAFTA